jgi:hypothetical protein
MKTNHFRLAVFSAMFAVSAFACSEPADDDADTGSEPESSEAELRAGPSAAPGTCTGVKVPGDYATLQAAIDSGSPRICLKAGTFDEPVHVVAPQKVVIQGVGARSIVRSVHVDRGGLELSHVTVSQGVTVLGWTVTSPTHPYLTPVQKVHIHDAWLRVTEMVSQGTYGPYASGVSNGGVAVNIDLIGRDGLDVEISDCDIKAGPIATQSGTPSGGIAVHANLEVDVEGLSTPAEIPVRVSLHGNAIHDSAVGIEARVAKLTAATLEIRENRLTRIRELRSGDSSGTALDIGIWDNGAGTRVSYERNEITRSHLGAAVYKFPMDQSVVTHQGNVVRNNTTNYAGIAQPD